MIVDERLVKNQQNVIQLKQPTTCSPTHSLPSNLLEYDAQEYDKPALAGMWRVLGASRLTSYAHASIHGHGRARVPEHSEYTSLISQKMPSCCNAIIIPSSSYYTCCSFSHGSQARCFSSSEVRCSGPIIYLMMYLGNLL